MYYFNFLELRLLINTSLFAAILSYWFYYFLKQNWQNLKRVKPKQKKKQSCLHKEIDCLKNQKSIT